MKIKYNAYVLMHDKEWILCQSDQIAMYINLEKADAPIARGYHPVCSINKNENKKLMAWWNDLKPNCKVKNVKVEITIERK
jgi:hypothetical protein